MTLQELVQTCEEGACVCESLKLKDPLSAASITEVFNRIRAGFISGMSTPNGVLEKRVTELETIVRDLVTALVKVFGFPPPLENVPPTDLGPVAQFARAYWAAADSVPAAP